MKRLALSGTALVLVAACGSGAGSPSTSTDSSSHAGGAGGTDVGVAPTFHKDVEPILQQKCQSCHAPGKIAPFSLMTYADAAPVAGLVAARTEDRSMPPFAARDTAECKPRVGWQHDLRLSDAEIATLDAWAKTGAAEGDPADAPPPVAVAEDGLPGVEIAVKPDVPFVASGDKDQFRCFVMDPGLTEDRFLNGSHFVAGNPAVVHHALMYLDTKGASASLAGPDGAYDCFGGPGFSGAALIGAWAPGGVPAEYPSNAGLPIPKGSRLVMQIHYHPAGASAAPDATTFQMRFTKSAPEWLASVALIGNDTGPSSGGNGLQPGPNDQGGVEFRIPAGAKGHTESMRFTFPKVYQGAPLPELKLYSIGTHMHYVGTDMLIGVVRESPTAQDPAEECLIQTPRWDFNWQRLYSYDAPIESLPTLRGGDRLDLRCTYDNSGDNPFVVKALLEQKLPAPVDVHLGETTLDEMCLGAFVVLYKSP
jgi:hypothetical protein